MLIAAFGRIGRENGSGSSTRKDGWKNSTVPMALARHALEWS